MRKSTGLSGRQPPFDEVCSRKPPILKFKVILTSWNSSLSHWCGWIYNARLPDRRVNEVATDEVRSKDGA